MMASWSTSGLSRWHSSIGMIGKFGVLSLLVLVGGFSPVVQLRAEQVILSIDSTQSFIDLEVDLLTVPLPEQGPGSTSASYSGLIVVDVDDTGAPTSLEILGSDFRAAVTGDWLATIGGGTVEEPGPPDPANYGYVIDPGALGTGIGYLVFRDFAYNIWNPIGPETVSNGSFLSTNQMFDILSGTWGINLPPSVFNDGEEILFDDSIIDDPEDGDFNFPESGNGLSTYAVVGSDVTLTIPIDLFSVDGSGNLEFISLGKLVANANLASPITSDFDQDGDTDGNDYLIWQRGFGIQGTATLADGDGNGDGNVDEKDLEIWRNLDDFLGRLPGPTPAAVAGVPEPASALLAGLSALVVVTCGATRRRGWSIGHGRGPG